MIGGRDYMGPPNEGYIYLWSNYSDWKHGSRFTPQKVAFWKGNPIISGKSRLVKYYSKRRQGLYLVYKRYFSCQLGDYMLPSPPFTRTWKIHWTKVPTTDWCCRHCQREQSCKAFRFEGGVGEIWGDRGAFWWCCVFCWRRLNQNWCPPKLEVTGFFVRKIIKSIFPYPITTLKAEEKSLFEYFSWEWRKVFVWTLMHEQLQTSTLNFKLSKARI